jgi:hypothetical protein
MHCKALGVSTYLPHGLMKNFAILDTNELALYRNIDV